MRDVEGTWNCRFHSCSTFARELHEEKAGVGCVRLHFCESPVGEPIDHTFDGCDIHSRVASQPVLRQRAAFIKLGQGCELPGGELITDSFAEDRNMALHDLPQNEAYLLVKYVRLRVC